MRFAVEATSVTEVAVANSENDSLRGLVELKELSALLSGEPEERPGMAVVLDVSPTLALRVRRVFEVADVARAPLFRLPQGVDPSFTVFTRGALLFSGQLYLELSPEALPHLGQTRPPVPP